MQKCLEIACFNMESARLAQSAGADRIELCENYVEGGLTPAEEMIREIRRDVNVPVHVIIRPRGGSFYYSELEKYEMKNSILLCKQHNMHGIVMGCLLPDNTVDIKACKEFIELASPMKITFHRAIDLCSDIKTEIQKLIDLGIERVLTSGGKETAQAGKEMLRNLQSDFGDKIIILPGGGIRSSNLQELATISKCNEYHSAALLKNAQFCDEQEIKTMKLIINSL